MDNYQIPISEEQIQVQAQKQKQGLLLTVYDRLLTVQNAPHLILNR